MSESSDGTRDISHFLQSSFSRLKQFSKLQRWCDKAETLISLDAANISTLNTAWRNSFAMIVRCSDFCCLRCPLLCHFCLVFCWWLKAFFEIRLFVALLSFLPAFVLTFFCVSDHFFLLWQSQRSNAEPSVKQTRDKKEERCSKRGTGLRRQKKGRSCNPSPSHQASLSHLQSVNAPSCSTTDHLAPASNLSWSGR